jgi:hypothetical protein
MHPQQGLQGDTKIITLPGGEKAVDKTYRDFTYVNPPIPAEEMADKDELTYYVSRAIGAGAPPLQRRASDRVLMGYAGSLRSDEYASGEFRKAREAYLKIHPELRGSAIEQARENYKIRNRDAIGTEELDAIPGYAIAHMAEENALDRLASTPEGVRIGVLDYLTGNRDRHGGNIMVTSDGKPVPIDHSSSRFDAFEVDNSIFSKPLADQGVPEEDINRWRAELMKTQPEFNRLGHPDYYANMMSQLERLDGQHMSKDRYGALLRGEPDSGGPWSGHGSPVESSISGQVSVIELAAVSVLVFRDKYGPLGTAELGDGGTITASDPILANIIRGKSWDDLKSMNNGYLWAVA